MKRIRKMYSGVVPNGKVLTMDSNSNSDTYSCSYINNVTKPKVLYDNPSGSNDTITLNDNVNNYKYLEIYFTNNASTGFTASQKIDLSNTLKKALQISWAGTDGTLYLASRNISISENSITTDSSRYSYFYIYGTQAKQEKINNIYILKVVGIQ